MRLAFLCSLAAGLAFLLLARYAAGPIWIDALWLCGASIGLAIALLIGILTRRLSSRRWQAWVSVMLGGGALAARSSLVGQFLGDERARLQVEFWRMSLAATTIVWGLLALVWGSLAISDAWEQKSTPASARWGQLLAASLAVAAALYSVAPLFSWAGLRPNIWTVVGLFALALAAHVLGAASRALLRGERRRRFR